MDAMREVMTAYVERGVLPGLVALVCRQGEVRVEVLGKHSSGSDAPMRRDTIFRISSMTKPVLAATAMTLVEEGKIDLDAPVERWLPELADRKVLLHVDAPLDQTVSAKRSITARDLLTFRLGFGMVWRPPDATPIQRAAAALHLGVLGPPRPEEPPAPDEWMRRFATLPLMHQPGERWMYNTGAEVLSALVARAAGRSLEAAMRERIFEPLEMKDTSFWVPAEKIDRLPVAEMAADPMHPDEPGSVLYDPPDGQWSRPPAFHSGAAGLVSTADDFLAFARMLLASGAHRGVRVLSPASVREMTTDALTPAQKAASDPMSPGFWDDHGWGLGMVVVTGPNALIGARGTYGWDGGLGTAWATDPAEGRIAILMTQRAAFPPTSGVYRDFWKAVRTGWGAG